MRRRSLLIVIATVLAVVIAFFVSETIMAPEAPQFENGEEISLTGELTCLPHKGDGPTTLECAIGFKSIDGDYYGLRDDTPGQTFLTGTPHGEQIQISGIFRAESHEKYQQIGVIEVKALAD